MTKIYQKDLYMRANGNFPNQKKKKLYFVMAVNY